jgi:hypothetical protein
LNLVRAYRLREKPPPRQQPGAPVFVPFTPSSRQSLLGIRRHVTFLAHVPGRTDQWLHVIAQPH